MSDNIIRLAYDKYRRGDHLTDKEVIILFRNFGRMYIVLRNLPDYKLAFYKCVEDYHRLEEIITARGLKAEHAVQ